VKGEVHKVNEHPNQDFIAWEQAETDGGEIAVLSLADGHGSDKHFLSHVGARFAVHVANNILCQFARATIGLSLTNVEIGTRRLPFQIVSEWKKCVEDDWKISERSKEAKRWLDNPEISRAIESSPLIAYGTTLLSVLVTAHFILYMHIGDGDIITIDAHGEVTEPVPPDERNFANEATSLCTSTAVQDFRIEFQRFGGNKAVPALIMLATDGYANSFLTRAGFYKVGSDIWQLIHANGETGLQTVEESLEAWLQRTTEMGSGDDITVGFLCCMSALQEEGSERKLVVLAGEESPLLPFQEASPSQQGIPGTPLDEQELDEPTEKRSTGRL
jgi:serine/threonine protein phosphatase PrpC